VIARERPRLKAWLRRQVPGPQDVEDILQDAFYEFVLAARLTESIAMPAHGCSRSSATASRPTTTGRACLRRCGGAGRRPGSVTTVCHRDNDESLVDLLPDPAAGPEQSYARKQLIRALEDACSECLRSASGKLWG
jgi:DNA-directed RNA polymerase specialized sigma24 family protein